MGGGTSKNTPAKEEEKQQQQQPETVDSSTKVEKLEDNKENTDSNESDNGNSDADKPSSPKAKVSSEDGEAPLVLLLFGPPGAGKGTHSPLLSKELGIPGLSTGDMLRGAVERRTELGVKCKEIMNSGGLVSGLTKRVQTFLW